MFAETLPTSSLITNSPFGQSDNSASSSPNESLLEFRGVFVDQGKTFVSLVELATRRASWVALNESKGTIAVKSYDPIREIVQVDYQGRQLSVPLQRSKINLHAAPPPAAAHFGNTGPVPKRGPAATSLPLKIDPVANPPGEAALQLARIAETMGQRQESGKPSDGPTPIPTLAHSSTRPTLEGM